ncbi:MAG: ImmA/IrrE family metallo-endopeptidase, partial [Caldilineaceae bacterium]|nr:ImmA/IrrE family metallo-endopeptidase [Caldilineaceae bacterium]
MAKDAFVDLDWAERQASMLRRDLQLSEVEILNPYELAEKMGFIELLPLANVQNISLECRQVLSAHNGKGWSAGSLAFPDGRVAVIMNPLHAKTRKRATLMEEIAHIHLAHKPSQLTVGNDGITARSYDAQQEKEAYWVGAAALVTMWHLQQAQKRKMT